MVVCLRRLMVFEGVQVVWICIDLVLTVVTVHYFNGVA